MNPVEAKLEQCFRHIRPQLPFAPRVALTLGSGLGAFAGEIRVEKTIDYREIEGFPVSTVPGHEGRFVFGYVEEVPVVVMQGRVHYYEGYAMSDVVLPARLMRKMGAEILFLTNAAGGINRAFSAGDLMLIRDHISMFVPSPLIGPNCDSLGVRFPDMSEVYDRGLRQIIHSAADANGLSLQEGVYLQIRGPAYETPTEIRMFGSLGADAVGMSTACEAMAARHCGLRVCGISCITNMAAGITEHPLDHAEVQAAADEAAPRFRKLLWDSIRAM